MAATFKIEKLNDFTVMANHHLRNKSLSLKAKGLQSLMLSLPEEWDYSLKGLAAICKDGIDSISSTLKELENAGYIARERRRNAKGQLTDTEYIIYQIPQKNASESLTDEKKPKRENPDQAKNKEKKTNNRKKPEREKPKQDKPKRENPVQAKPDTAEPDTVKRPQLNIQESNTNKSNTQSIHQSWKTDGEIEEIRETIKENINYDYACKSFGREIINSIVDIMTEVYMVEGSIIVGKQSIAAGFVQAVFDKIEYEHIQYVLDCMEEAAQKSRIRNIKKYLLTALYNAPMTMDSYYSAEWKFDTYGDQESDYSA